MLCIVSVYLEESPEGCFVRLHVLNHVITALLYHAVVFVCKKRLTVMPCYHPITGYRSKHVNSSGKRPIVFNRAQGFIDMQVEVPCGRCIGCRLEKSRQWAMRLQHENSLHEKSCFITLTYDDEHLPPDNSLDVKHFQLFMKRLRHHYQPQKIRFFHCGEYGERTNRPHYHAILFGLDFEDKKYFKKSGEHSLFRSDTLENLWHFGHSNIGSVSFESCAYVARYITKKITGDMAGNHYGGRRPEYCTMSRRPGIGSGWIKKYKEDVYPSDEVIVRGQQCKPPRFYDRVLEKEFPEEYEVVKARRIADAKANSNSADNSYRRLNDRETCVKARQAVFKREPGDRR